MMRGVARDPKAFFRVPVVLRGGREGLAISEANEFVSSKIAENAIYLVFVFGILLLIVGKPIGVMRTWL